jgi:uncharacterized protein
LILAPGSRPAARTGAFLGLLFTLFALVAAFAGAGAAPSFPKLTGRVVDAAHILSPVASADLERKLADLEQRSGIQLEVATVSSLGGEEIEPYANALFREWKLGEAKKNDGALLLVAPNQHRVRIEVGYGLEGTLTDAISVLIIANAIAPRFKSGDFDGGVARGVADIITTLTTDSAQWQKKPDFRAESDPGTMDAIAPFLIFFFIALVIFILARRGGGWRRGAVFLPTGGGGSSGGGGFSGGGFSGGGGSSGGGGASGSW